MLTLIQQRQEAGTASALEVAQQETLVASQRAQVPVLDEVLRQNKATLALLIGRPPEFVRVRGGSLYALGIPRVSPGLPSELLYQRPDIRSAEATVAATDASVERARAAFFPSIQLTGQGGFTSTALRALFRPESAFYSLAAGLTQPIFDGFLLEGQLELAQGRQLESLSLYRKAVVSGFTDVERALISVPGFRAARAAAAAGGGCLPARLQYRRDPAAGRHRGPGDGADHATGAVHGRGKSRYSTASAFAGRVEPLPGAWRQLAAEAARRAGHHPAMKLKPLVIVLVGFAVVAAAVTYWPSAPPTQQGKGGMGGKGKRAAGPTGTDPVPVRATVAQLADVPVYLDGVGTARALNTVLVKPQVEGKLIAVSFTEGQDVPRGYVLAKIDPTTYQAQYDQAGGDQGAARSAACECPARPGTLHAAGGKQRHQQAAGRHPARAGGAARSTGAHRPGR